MNENEPNVHIDYQGLLSQLADKIIIDFMASIMPDEKTKKIMVGVLSVHRKYGIDAATSVKILTDLAEVFKEDK
jgi:hypothetical protein